MKVSLGRCNMTNTHDIVGVLNMIGAHNMTRACNMISSHCPLTTVHDIMINNNLILLKLIIKRLICFIIKVVPNVMSP